AGLMYVTCGDRFQMKQAQDLSDLAGKIVRLKDDGSVPPDNPFVGRPGVRPEIFTYGNRNPQGLALHPETGKIWEVEHGPRGGDERLIEGRLPYIRDVRQGPDGLLYLITHSDDGGLFRLEPA